ncbi:MAG: RloB family protein [Stagnimonas sp.]|nr:RloB family protein [Stagnimonas sp.]
MGADNQPKARQAAKLQRKQGRRPGLDRILIVCEGSKTEPQYLEEIRQQLRLPSAHIEVRHSLLGTCPMQVVECAEQLFREGNMSLGIKAKSFEQVYAVFDRDEHLRYAEALAHAAALDGRLKNDLKQKVKFEAIASVPCFELWLLLHFEDCLAPIDRGVARQRLRRHLPDYEKGQGGHYANTQDHFDIASGRAAQLAARTTAMDGIQPYTDMHRLVAVLTQLKK